ALILLRCRADATLPATTGAIDGENDCHRVCRLRRDVRSGLTDVKRRPIHGRRLFAGAGKLVPETL
ncbi:MAG: hypothetical protein KIS74_06050, partial [Burkholderiales bacterium]|nr:hypothetical protein [Burkholderiales bacterium]